MAVTSTSNRKNNKGHGDAASIATVVAMETFEDRISNVSFLLKMYRKQQVLRTKFNTVNYAITPDRTIYRPLQTYFASALMGHLRY